MNKFVVRTHMIYYMCVVSYLQFFSFFHRNAETPSNTSVTSNLLVAVIIPGLIGLAALTLLLSSVVLFYIQMGKKKLNPSVLNLSSEKSGIYTLL